jgi:hypothetical protein
MMNEDIRFRVEPNLRKRAEKVIRLRSAGRVNKENISTFGREGFFQWLIRAEEELGIGKPTKAA